MKGSFGGFDSAEVAVLQLTFDLACRELGITPSDEEARARIAKAVISLAKAGQFDPDSLTLHAISRFRDYDGERLQ
ncbi:MAG: hypothetical protein JSR78_08200 [Proteobacteria bacterium]|nr:hypothetical protein [Pseudomonadota bacterium]